MRASTGSPQAAGLSKGTFYWHFKSKEELFLALVEERIDAPARSLIDVTRTAPREAASAPVVSRGLADLFAGERDLLVLVQEYWAAAVRSAPVRRRYRRRRAALVDALAGALRARHETTGRTAHAALPSHWRRPSSRSRRASRWRRSSIRTPSSAGLYGEILSLVYDGLAARAR